MEGTGNSTLGAAGGIGVANSKGFAGADTHDAYDVVEAVRELAGDLPQVEIAYESDILTLWVTIRPEPKPIFTFDLLASLGKVQRAVLEMCRGRYATAPIRFLAFRGEGPFFTLGGDLDYYLGCIARNDRASLREYARLSAEGALLNTSCIEGHVITLSTIHAKAIGGGIDAPRSCQVMIAEEQATFVYPEVKFNHFPITAVPILSRRMGDLAAERMLLSGDEYTAGQMFAAGGIEAVVPTGTGEDWLRKFAQDSLPSHSAKLALYTSFHRRKGDLAEELHRIGDAWTDCMLSLSDAEIAKLQRIAQTQDKMLARMKKAAA